MLISHDHKERFGDKEYFLPDGWMCFNDICYEDDGSPVYIPPEGVILKLGKRKFVRIKINI